MHARVCVFVYDVWYMTQHLKHHQNSPSLKGIVRSFGSAFRGIRVLLENEYNLYIQIAFALIGIVLGFYFYITPVQWMFLLVSIGLVIYSELVNTAIEMILDHVHPEYSRKVGQIKELASASVLFMVFISVAVACIIFIPYIF